MKSKSETHRGTRWLIICLAGLIIILLARDFFAAKPDTSASGAVPTFDRVLTEADQPGLGNARQHRMLAFVESLDAAQIGSTLDRVQAQNPFGRAYELVRALYARWTELDRPAALDHALNLTGNNRQSSLGSVVTFWAEREPQLAWQWFEENAETIQQPFAGTSILTTIAREQPEKALALFSASQVMQRSFSSNGPDFLYGTWAGNDPEAAATHLQANLKHPNHRRAAISRIISAWIARDPDAAWTWAKQLPGESERLRAMETSITYLAINDLDRARVLLEEFSEGKARRSVISSLLSTVAMNHPEKAVELVKQSLPTDETSQILGQAYSIWAIRDPEQAFAAASKDLKPGSVRKSTLQDIVRRAATQNVDLGLKLLKQLGLTSDHPSAASAVARTMAERDIEQAVTWAESLPDGEMKTSAVQAVLSTWLEEDAQQAIDYALEQDGESPRQSLVAYCLNRWGYLDPPAAVEWAHKNLDLPTHSAQIASAVERWAEHELRGASDWTAALPAGPLYDACLARIAYQWGYRDPIGGDTWLQSLEPGPARDQAISNYAGRADEFEPELALDWAGKIDDEKLRERTIENSARRYLRSQPEKAAAWIESSSLSDKQKQTLLRAH